MADSWPEGTEAWETEEVLQRQLLEPMGKGCGCAERARCPSPRRRGQSARFRATPKSLRLRQSQRLCRKRLTRPCLRRWRRRKSRSRQSQSPRLRRKRLVRLPTQLRLAQHPRLCRMFHRLKKQPLLRSSRRTACMHACMHALRRIMQIDPHEWDE